MVLRERLSLQVTQRTLGWGPERSWTSPACGEESEPLKHPLLSFLNLVPFSTFQHPQLLIGHPCPPSSMPWETGSGDRGLCGSWQGALTGTGCPSKSELIFLRFSSSVSGRKPASAQTAYRMGAAWPCQGMDGGGRGQRGS